MFELMATMTMSVTGYNITMTSKCLECGEKIVDTGTYTLGANGVVNVTPGTSEECDCFYGYEDESMFGEATVHYNNGAITLGADFEGLVFQLIFTVQS